MLALGYLVLQSAVMPDTALVSVLFWLTFLVAAVTGTLVIVLDQALVALGRGASATSRYALGGGVSLGAAALVAWLSHGASADVLMACWTLGTTVACVVGAVQLRRLVGYRPRPSLRSARGRPLLAMGLPYQLLTLTERAPGLVLPLLLAHMVAPEAAAYWYPAWMMAWAAYSAPMLMGIVQFSEGVRDPDRLVSTTWASLRLSLAVGGLAAAVLVILAHPLLSLLGERYADSSAGALRWLAAGLVPYAVLQAYNAVCRARGTLHGGDRGRRDSRSRPLRLSAVGRRQGRQRHGPCVAGGALHRGRGGRPPAARRPPARQAGCAMSRPQARHAGAR